MTGLIKRAFTQWIAPSRKTLKRPKFAKLKGMNTPVSVEVNPANPSTSLFEETLGIAKPTCCSQGDCCKGASPSAPVKHLWAKAAAGDEFARGFLSIFKPYESHEAARAVVPGLVERTLKAAQNAMSRPDSPFETLQDVVFYHCRYLGEDNRCTVYEDRPDFCRTYPDTPFVVMAPGCAYEGWGQACRSKYQALQENLAHLKHQLKQTQAADELEQPENPFQSQSQGSSLSLSPERLESLRLLPQISQSLQRTSLYLTNRW